ncbi:response regulator [Azospirillum rugosum]|uniref:CheY-like chemotaxis protein n=1 Tax=Azospirillum rugosum TaxID=416170 RepID=A0ABS4SHS4_9PROT|nr:response regulator [Azospirillum rugosum]MBP2291593.1 CheY-like chemotaxis protein [Azospirillum rugosum]MDQ0524595.1 CheY-like chemotaxis protein [Azospirillum rugosum]
MAKVLVVEDSAAVRLAVTEVIEQAGHTVSSAENGRVAIELLQGETFDLIVTDVLMPEADGLEVIKEARARHPKTQVLAMSGGAPNLPAGYALKMAEMFAADAVLFKPFLNEELKKAVARLLAETADNGH